MRDDDALEHNPKVQRQALEALHESLFGWCLSRCNYDRAAAEDLMQEAYMELLSGRARFDGRSTLKTFLFGVVQMLVKGRRRRLALRLRLASKAAPEAPGVDDAAPPFDDVMLEAESRLARSAVRRRAGLGLSGLAAAIALSVLLHGGPDSEPPLDFAIEDALMTQTLWRAPSDGLMPDHLVDVYAPLAPVSTEVVEGTLL